jgi:lysozyme
MKISQNGIDLIKHFEGLRLTAYRCTSGVLTIGYGHTKTVKAGQRITKATAEDLLRQDIKEYEDAVNRLVKVQISQNLFDALVSFAFNCGIGNLTKSTLLKKVNNKASWVELAPQFRRWSYGRGVKVAGLVRRREAEVLLAGGLPWKTSATLTDSEERKDTLAATGNVVEAEWIRHEESANNPAKNTTVVGSTVAIVLAAGNEIISNPATIAASLKDSANELSGYTQYVPIVSGGITALMVASLVFVIFNRVKKIFESKH